MDEELLLTIHDLTPRETQPKAETRIPRLSEFVSRAPCRTDGCRITTGFGATSGLGGRSLSGGVSVERFKL